MEDKFSKYNSSPFGSQSTYLQSEVRMLEERLKNLDYLKQTYERNAKEKSLEIEVLTRELSEYKTETYEKNRKLEELNMIYNNKESTLLRVIEEHRSDKITLEEELSSRSLQISRLEKSLQEQYEKSLAIIDENQLLRKEIKENEQAYNNHISQLEEKLQEITISQRITEERVNSIIFTATPKKKKLRARREEPGKINQMYKKELAINKSLKNIITDLYKKNPEEIEDRLQNSEKKLKELEYLVNSSSKNELYSPITSLKSTAKLRSSSQSFKNRNNKY